MRAGEPTPVVFSLTRGGPAPNDVDLDVRLGWPQEGDGPFADDDDFTGGEVWGRNSGGGWDEIGGFSFGQSTVTLPAGYSDMRLVLRVNEDVRAEVAEQVPLQLEASDTLSYTIATGSGTSGQVASAAIQRDFDNVVPVTEIWNEFLQGDGQIRSISFGHLGSNKGNAPFAVEVFKIVDGDLERVGNYTLRPAETNNYTGAYTSVRVRFAGNLAGNPEGSLGWEFE